MAHAIRKALRLPAVLEALGVSKTTFYDGITAGIYPKPTKLSPGGKSSIWFEDEIAAVQARASAREAA